MHIVSQSASLPYSLFPPTLLLPAPPERKLLAAPRIAGLLAASVSTAITPVESASTLAREGILTLLGPIRSREEMNAEIADLVAEAWEFLHKTRTGSARQQ